MAPGETSLLSRNPWVARRVLTVAEYHRMAEAGILTERDRVELIEVDLIAMSPIGSEHSGTVNALNRTLVRAVGDRAIVAVQNPVQLDDLSEPEPDFALLKTLPVQGAIVTSRATSTGFDFVSRYFAPRAGIDEDPVTGSAHCCLGPFWRQQLNKDTFVAYQASARGGVMRVQVQGDRVVLSGQAVTVLRGELLD